MRMTSGGIGGGGGGNGGLILADWLYVASASAQVQNESRAADDGTFLLAMAAAVTTTATTTSADVAMAIANGTLMGSGSSGIGIELQRGDQETALDLITSLLVGFFLAVIIFLSVAGNLLVCIAVYTDRTLRKVGNLFIVSLAISDLFVACLVMVFAVSNDLQGYWVFGEQFCDIWVAFDVMCSTASILNLCAISMDRYIHIKDPLRYGRWMTKRVIYGSIGAIWLLAATISFLPVLLHLHKPEQQLSSSSSYAVGGGDDDVIAATTVVQTDSDDDNDDVDVDVDLPLQPLPQCALDLTPTYAIVSSCISFYLPCLVMLAIYSRLFFYAKMHVQNIKAVSRPVILGRYEPDPVTGEDEINNRTSRAGGGGASGGGGGGRKRRHHSPNGGGSYHVSDHKAAITLGIIMGTFLICWVPFFCVNIVASFCKTCIPPIVFKFLTWLGYSNSAFNPIIYSIFNLEFRLAFRRILTTRPSTGSSDAGRLFTSYCCCCCDLDHLGPTGSPTEAQQLRMLEHRQTVHSQLNGQLMTNNVLAVPATATAASSSSVTVRTDVKRQGSACEQLLIAEGVV